MNKLYRQVNFFICVVVFMHNLSAPVRSVVDFNKDWKFFLGNDSTASQIDYDDGKWRKISLRHDRSIESNFMEDAPATNQGGSLPGGIGWYRKTFMLPANQQFRKWQPMQ